MPRWARNVPLPEPHLFGLAVGIAAGIFAPWTLPVPSWLRVAGLCLVGAGLALVAWATWASVDTHLADPDRVIRRGPYAVSRNPMYVGWTVAYLGVAVALANVWLVVLLPAVLLVTDVAVRREERRLQARFGPAYTDYVTSVRRYV